MPDANGAPTPEETAAAAAAAATAQQPDAAALQEQLSQAQARNMELETAALRTANPDLPDAVFAGPDLAAIQAGVTTARAVADHVRTQAEAVRNGAAPPPPPTPTGAGATRTPEPIPDTVRGTARIARALEREQAGA